MASRLPERGLLTEVEPGPDFDERGQGFITRIDVTPISGHPDAMLVITGVSIPCDSDESVYVYRRMQGRWVRIFELERADYSVAGRSEASIALWHQRHHSREMFGAFTTYARCKQGALWGSSLFDVGCETVTDVDR